MPQRRESIKAKGAAISDVLPPRIGSHSLGQIELDNLQNLPPVPFELRSVISASFSSGLPIFEFCGEGFVKQFIMLDHQDYSVLFNAFLLLSYAHCMALTGQGSKTTVLDLKGQLIRRIGKKMETSEGSLSPWYMTAILVLETPIVCLVSRDLPMRLSMSEYIHASMQEDYLCCLQESADKAQSALDERIVHRQAMNEILNKSKAGFKDAHSLALLQYVCNWTAMWVHSKALLFQPSADAAYRSMAIEAANYPTTLLADVKNLFPATKCCESCSIPTDWASPLTHQWVEDFPAHVETQMLVLARLMHRWLATFLDGECHQVLSTEPILQERAMLRQQIERFEPVAATSSSESDAMYESCRWASLVLRAVEEKGISIQMAAKHHVRIRPRLVRRLRMTNLANLWGPHRGLLFWVISVCYFATAGRCFPLICTTLFARFTQEFAMSPYCSEIAIIPLKRLKTFESLCFSKPYAIGCRDSSELT